MGAHRELRLLARGDSFSHIAPICPKRRLLWDFHLCSRGSLQVMPASRGVQREGGVCGIGRLSPSFAYACGPLRLHQRKLPPEPVRPSPPPEGSRPGGRSRGTVNVSLLAAGDASDQVSRTQPSERISGPT